MRGEEGGLKRSCRRVLCTLLRWPLGNQGGLRKADGYKIKRVLVLRHDEVPDMAASLPAFGLIKRLAPQCRLEVLASAENLALARVCPDVDAAHLFPRDWLGRLGVITALRKQNYDLILNLMFTQTSANGLVANLIGGRKALKAAHYSKLEHSVFYNIQALSTHRALSMWEMLPAMVTDAIAGYTGALEEGPSMVIPREHLDSAARHLEALGLGEGAFVALHWDGRDSAFKWSEAAGAELIQRVSEELGLKVLLLCKNLRRAEMEELGRRLPGSVVYPVETSLLEAAAVLAKARLLVAADIGLLQVAYALRVSAVSLCPALGRLQELWKPLGESPWRQILAPRGCGVTVIPAGRVWEAVAELAVRY